MIVGKVQKVQQECSVASNETGWIQVRPRPLGTECRAIRGVAVTMASSQPAWKARTWSLNKCPLCVRTTRERYWVPPGVMAQGHPPQGPTSA